MRTSLISSEAQWIYNLPLHSTTLILSFLNSSSLFCNYFGHMNKLGDNYAKYRHNIDAYSNERKGSSSAGEFVLPFYNGNAFPA